MCCFRLLATTTQSRPGSNRICSYSQRRILHDHDTFDEREMSFRPKSCTAEHVPPEPHGTRASGRSSPPLVQSVPNFYERFHGDLLDTLDNTVLRSSAVFRVRVNNRMSRTVTCMRGCVEFLEDDTECYTLRYGQVKKLSF